MHTGSLRVRMFVRESRTLKDKRQVVKSILDRVRNNYNVAAAEVDAQDDRQLAILGFAAVGNEAGHVRSSLEAIVNHLRSHPVAEFLDYELEV